ncbi:hypothetical protein [Mycobacteroides franklinii]|nr:hypothetical protein [Mycobacteroides franklinii]
MRPSGFRLGFVYCPGLSRAAGSRVLSRLSPGPSARRGAVLPGGRWL